ncbi:MAG: T9SS type A sorting domain-containing protein, partial [Salinivenus sp.]
MTPRCPGLVFALLVALLAGVVGEARAQITITAQDARDFLAPGVYGQQFLTAEPGEAARIQGIIDQVGPGGTYDFSAVEVSTVSFDVGEVQARPFDASVPADADFDDADFVDVSDPFGNSPSYTFFDVEDDGYYEYGDLSSLSTFTLKTTYVPPLRAFPLPLTATTTWSSGDVTASFYTNGVLDSTEVTSYAGEVIGDGTLILPGGRTLPTLVHRSVQVEGSETTTALSFVTKGQRDAVTVLTDGNRTVLEFPTGSGASAPAAFFFLKSEAAAEAAIAQNTTGLFLGGTLGASVELTEGSATNGQLRGYRIDFPSFNNAIDDTGLPAGFPVENVSQAGYWVIREDNLSDASYRVCLDYGDVGGIADASELAVLTRDSAAEPWQTLGSTVDTGGQQVCTDGLTAFSEFAIGGSAANALPVELARFEGTWSEEGTRLTWETAAERNNAGFEVQRRFEGGPFATMGFVEGAGTSDEGRSYRFVDAQIPFAADALTYRLRQVDLDGTAHLHAPVTLGRGVPDRLAVLAPYPNPTTGTATLSYTLPDAGPVRIAVYNVLGQEMAVLAQGEERAGRVERHLDLSRLPSGAYFVRLAAAGQ